MVAGIKWRFVDADGRLHHSRPLDIAVDELPPGGCAAAQIAGDDAYSCALCNADWSYGEGSPPCAMARADYVETTRRQGN